MTKNRNTIPENAIIRFMKTVVWKAVRFLGDGAGVLATPTGYPTHLRPWSHRIAVRAGERAIRVIPGLRARWAGLGACRRRA
ncbi:hypothetical protein [Actinomyces slackii]|uniref:hypothetical protein n=1 Tax=Actinomyces slackii TaxID=52774 RepID=UPI00146FB0A9|nr:hypothetical protein [Actinomyces slackii]